MELVTKEIDIGSRTPTVLLNSADASELGVHPLDRVLLRTRDRVDTGIVEVTDELVSPGHLGVTRALGQLSGTVDVSIAPMHDSVAYLHKKLDDVELEMHEIGAIVRDINRDRLNDVELSAFVSGVYANGLSREEMTCLTTCMVDVGETIEWPAGPVLDKHSIGGVAGNRVTPIVVPIVAAAGQTIPKTSSRAVTSAAGTADTMEVFCDVEFSLEEIRDIVAETNGCMVWGGAVNLSPVDDKLIRAATPLSLDPPGQVVASVLSKKKSAGSTRVVVDIPYGEGAKVESLPAAREMAEDFRRVGDTLEMDVECTITRGDQPIGRGIGPVLEARDVLDVLAGKGPESLRAKGVRLAQVLLEAVDVDETAADLLASGAADAKFREIIAAQNGDATVTRDDLRPGPFETTVRADTDGIVMHVDNRGVNELARRTGSPKDHGAGVLLYCRPGESRVVDDPLCTLYAEKEEKLDQAVAYLDENDPIRITPDGETLVERV